MSAQHLNDVHKPVMCQRISGLLSANLKNAGSVYVDGTLGLGGHAMAILSNCPEARLVGIDRDPQALEIAKERLKPFSNRVILVKAVYDELSEVLNDLGIDKVQAILLDLGLSSLQIDLRERGFSYSVDAPLDMRMDNTSGLTAEDVVNSYSPSDLSSVISSYGEERFANRIAKAIVKNREINVIKTSAQLTEIIVNAIPKAAQKGRGHPAKRTFQALRIEVNDELGALKKVLPQALKALSLGGRVAVLAYHSLEDRLVKQVFFSASTDRAPRQIPVVPESLKAEFKLLTKGAERPELSEIEINSRATSAKLRVAERIKETK